MNELENVGLCNFCNGIIVKKQKYYIYRLGFRTATEAYTIGIMKVCEELSNELVKKGVHLSATQVILLRPDITLEFLKSKYNKPNAEILEYKLIEAEACEKCYANYVQEVPER